MKLGKSWKVFAFAALVLMLWTVGPAPAAEKPNILVIWGDDVGVHNISAYNHGIMGYKTPNIDRIAKEGAMFTDAYAQQLRDKLSLSPLRTESLKEIAVAISLQFREGLCIHKMILPCFI